MVKTYIQDDTNYGFIVKGTIGGHVFYVDSCYTKQIHPDAVFVEAEIPRLRKLNGCINKNISMFPTNIYFSDETDVAGLCELLSDLPDVSSVYATCCARILGLWEGGKLIYKKKLSDCYLDITAEEDQEVSF